MYYSQKCTCWFRDSTNHSSPIKLQAMSTSPLYTKTRYFCRKKTLYAGVWAIKQVIPQVNTTANQVWLSSKTWQQWERRIETDQSRQQLQVLFPDVQVQTPIIQIHLRAATKRRSNASPTLSKVWRKNNIRVSWQVKQLWQLRSKPCSIALNDIEELTHFVFSPQSEFKLFKLFSFSIIFHVPFFFSFNPAKVTIFI